MNDTQTLILKGCKFILTLGGSRWDSSLTRKALARLRDLCEMELGEKPIPEPVATPEFTDQLFNGKQNETQS
jgi:hypothetical protein